MFYDKRKEKKPINIETRQRLLIPKEIIPRVCMFEIFLEVIKF